MAFTYQIDFAGAKAQGAMGEKGGGYKLPTEGVYKVEITDITPHETQKDGAVSTTQCFQTKIAEGEFAGSELRIYLGIDFTKEGVRNQWYTALLSAGYSESDILANKNFRDEDFKGRHALIQFIPAKDGSNNHRRNFITPASYQTLLAKQNGGAAVSQTVSTASAVSVPAMNVATPRPAGGGLRGMLGTK